MAEIQIEKYHEFQKELLQAIRDLSDFDYDLFEFYELQFIIDEIKKVVNKATHDFVKETAEVKNFFDEHETGPESSGIWVKDDWPHAIQKDWKNGFISNSVIGNRNNCKCDRFIQSWLL